MHESSPPLPRRGATNSQASIKRNVMDSYRGVLLLSFMRALWFCCFSWVQKTGSRRNKRRKLKVSDDGLAKCFGRTDQPGDSIQASPCRASNSLDLSYSGLQAIA